MSILTQFLPTVNAHIGEIKVVLGPNNWIAGNTTGLLANTLTDIDGGVWLRTGVTYKIADYPQLANTLGTFGGITFRSNDRASGMTNTIVKLAYAYGPDEFRMLSATGSQWSDSTYWSPGTYGISMINTYNQGNGEGFYDITHNSLGTGLRGNTWGVCGSNGFYTVGDYSGTSIGLNFGSGTTPVNGTPITTNRCIWGPNITGVADHWLVRGNLARYWYRDGNPSWEPWKVRQDPNFLSDGAAGNTGEAGFTTAAMIYAANTYVALASEYGVVSFSANANNWAGIPGPYYDTGAVREVVYANGVFVAVGQGSRHRDYNYYVTDPALSVVATSTDGYVWTKRTSSTWIDMNALAYGNNVWIAGGESSNIIYSVDNGVNWTNVVSANLSTSVIIRSIGYSSNVNGTPMFCAVGDSGAIYITSNANATYANANTWRSVSQNSGSQQITCVKYVPTLNVWMAGNVSGALLTSTDGITWARGGFATPGQAIDRMDVSNNTVVVGTRSGYISYASISDLVNTGVANVQGRDIANVFSGFPGTANTITHCAYGDNTYVATAVGGVLMTSNNGITWNRDSLFFSKTSSTTLRSVAYANTGPGKTKWIVVGDGLYKISQNAFNWSGQQNTQTANIINSIAYGAINANASIYVAGGWAGNLSISDDAVYWRSINATTSTIYTVCYGNNRFLYSGLSGALATSPDGENWTDASNTTAELNSAAFGNNIYIIVGNSGILRRSNNGVYWQTANSNSVQNLLHVEYGNNLFLAVGTNGDIITSANGLVWTRQNANAFSTNTLYACAYGGSQNLYVYGGQSGNIATSTDGRTWLGRTSGTASEIRAIAASPTLFVYATLSGGLASSTDGITWTSRTSGTTNSFYAALFANNLYVVAGQNGNLITSTDGTTWTGRTSNTNLQINTLIYDSNTRLYMYGTTSGNVGTSTDGVTWVSNNQVTTTTILGSAYGNNANVSVICGSTGFIRHTYNVAGRYSGSNTTTLMRASAYGNGTFIVTGDSGVLRTSTDGVFWDYKIVTANAMYAAIYANDKFIISGVSGNTSYSLDNGATWNFVSLGTANTTLGIAYGNNRFVRVSGSGNVGTSINGISWNISADASVNALGNNIWTVAYNNVSNTFFYSGTNYRSAVSADGQTWTTVFPYANTTNQTAANSAVFGNNEIVVVGWGGVPIKSRANDSNTWYTFSPRTNAIMYGVAYGSNVWVTVGANGNVRTSTDGLYWSIQDANVNMQNPYNYRNQGERGNLLFVEYQNGRFLTGGEWGTFRYSTDGYNWVPVNFSGDLNLDASLTGVTYGQGKYVVVGNGYFVATSTDLVNWTKARLPFTPYLNYNIGGSLPTGNLHANLTTVVYNPTTNTFAIGGFNRTYFTSTDAITWVDRRDNTGLKELIHGINHLSIGDNGKFVYVGTNSMVGTSTDGIRWGGSGITGNILFNTVNALSYSVQTGLYVISNGACFSTSTDLWHWNRSPQRAPLNISPGWQYPSWINNITTGGANGNVTIACGSWFTNLLWSRDGGQRWSSLAFDKPGIDTTMMREGVFYSPWDMAYGNNKFYAVCSRGRVVTSTDGFTWDIVETVPWYKEGAYRSISYGKGQWMITGGSGAAGPQSGLVLFTRDFINWKRAIIQTSNTSEIYAGAIGANITRVASASPEANNYYTFNPDPSQITQSYGWTFDYNTEFHVPKITLAANTSALLTNINFYSISNTSASFGGQTGAATPPNGNNFPEFYTYIKAK